MSATLAPRSRAPRAAVRLLQEADGDPHDGPDLQAHLARWGDLHHRPPPTVLDELAASGLAGHGGGFFPVAAKWRAIGNRSRRSPVVVANGAESEPASHKDTLLLTQTPHLVLDGLAVAANTLRARRAVVYVSSPSLRSVEQAITERRRARMDPVIMEAAEAPDRFLAGQESAVVNVLSGRRQGLPSFVGLESIRERGVDGRPTLVQNVETLAHVGMVARYGAEWFRRVGTHEWPGTMLLTLTRPGGPQIVEAEFGTSLMDTVGLTRKDAARYQGALLGGYGGGWVPMTSFSELALLEKDARRAGATLGPGVVVLLPRDVCALAEMAEVVNYMESQGAGQCGPCVNGLAELADALDDLAFGSGRSDRRIPRILALCDLVDGRGACRHPDGVARFVRTGITVFADEVQSHQRHGACPATAAPRFLPVPNRCQAAGR